MEDSDGFAGTTCIDASFCPDLCRVDHFHDATVLQDEIERVVDAVANVHRLLHLRRCDFKTIKMAIH